MKLTEKQIAPQEVVGKTITAADRPMNPGNDSDASKVRLTLDDGQLLYLTVNTVFKGDDIYGAGIGTVSRQTSPAFPSFVNQKVTRFEYFTEMNEDDKDKFVPWLVDFAEQEDDYPVEQSVFFVLADGTRIDGTLVEVVKTVAAGK